MSQTLEQDLSGVPETLLITLYMRAMETQRPDALIKDEKTVALVAHSESEAEESIAVRPTRASETERCKPSGPAILSTLSKCAICRPSV